MAASLPRHARLTFLATACAIGILMQFMRTGFLSIIFGEIGATSLPLYGCYGTCLGASGLLLLFYDRPLSAGLPKSGLPLVCIFAGLGGLGILQIPLPFPRCIGASLLAIFVALAFALVCDAVSQKPVIQIFYLVILGFAFSFALTACTVATPSVRSALVAVAILIIAGTLFAISRTPRTALFYFAKKPSIPTRFLITILLLCVVSNFFTGLVESSSAFRSSPESIHWATWINLAFALIALLAAKLGLGIQRILFWSWFSLSLGFFLGVVLLALPSPELISFGSDIITTLRVMIECLLLILVIMIASQEHMHAMGLAGLFFILPTGCSILLRNVAAPLITSAWSESFLGFLPALVLFVTLFMLFSQYSFSNRASFNAYFNPPIVDRNEIRNHALDDLCRDRGLTQREREVLELIAQGYTMKACAEKLVVSLDTIRSHCKSIYRKLDVHTKQEIISYISRFEEQSNRLP